jgi:hypothetical protein
MTPPLHASDMSEYVPQEHTLSPQRHLHTSSAVAPASVALQIHSAYTAPLESTTVQGPSKPVLRTTEEGPLGILWECGPAGLKGEQQEWTVGAISDRTNVEASGHSDELEASSQLDQPEWLQPGSQSEQSANRQARGKPEQLPELQAGGHCEELVLHAVDPPEQPATILQAVCLPEQPATRLQAVCLPEQPTTRLQAVCLPEQPATRLQAVCLPEQPATRLQAVCLPEQPATRLHGVCLPEQPATRLQAVCLPEQPATRLQAVCLPEQPATRLQAVCLPEQPATRLQAVCLAEQPASRLQAVCLPEQRPSSLAGQQHARLGENGGRSCSLTRMPGMVQQLPVRDSAIAKSNRSEVQLCPLFKPLGIHKGSSGYTRSVRKGHHWISPGYSYLPIDFFNFSNSQSIVRKGWNCSLGFSANL